MLHAKSLPHKLWVEALICANCTKNRSPHRSVKDQTFLETWSGTKPEVTHFRVFGSRAWARIPFEKRKSLDPQRNECIFVGYPDVHAYDDPHPSPDRASSSESTSPVINQRTSNLSEIYAQDHPATRNGLVGDNSDPQRTSSEFIEPPLSLTATEPTPSRHCHLVKYSDPQSFAEATGHPSWESAMEQEYNSLLENQT
eukprot:PITA_26365